MFPPQCCPEASADEQADSTTRTAMTNTARTTDSLSRAAPVVSSPLKNYAEAAPSSGGPPRLRAASYWQVIVIVFGTAGMPSR